MSIIRATAQWSAVCAFCLCFSYVLVEGLDRQLANEQATYSYHDAVVPVGCITDCECEGC